MPQSPLLCDANSPPQAEEEEYKSDGLDESEDEEAARAAKRRRTAKGKGKAAAVEAPKTKKAKAAAKRKAKRAAKGSDDDDDYEDSDDDEYTAPARGLLSPSKKIVDPNVRPPNGSFEECAECQKDFTVVSSSFSLF